MPSFAKPEMPKMEDVFKLHPHPEVLQGMVRDYRDLARQHLQQSIPAKILRIREMLSKESDQSNVFNPGCVHAPDFTPRLFQPEDPAVAHLKPLLPDAVTREELKIISERAERAIDLAKEDDETILNEDMKILTIRDGDGDGSGKGGDNWSKTVVGAHWFEVLKQNEAITTVIDASLQEYEDLLVIIQDLRVWLELEVPVIEDGNSFGADVQAHLAKELMETYKRANNFQTGCRQHFHDRLKLAVDWVKYPNLMDFQAAIQASDRADHVTLRSFLRSLLICYAGLLNRFERNWQKVINPKGTASTGAMY